MDLGASGTTFGQGSGTSVEKEQSLGVSTGFSVGTEIEDRLFSQSKARFSLSVETSLDWTATQSRQLEKAYYCSGTSESDKVVFATIPFDVYYYRVVSSPNPEEVDTTMIINLPREPQVLFVDRDFFNAHNGNFMDIGERLLTHEIGVPSSYPSEESLNLDRLPVQGGAYSDTMTVGQGSGSQKAEIILSEGEGEGTSFDLSITTEFEVGAGGFFAGGSVGFHYGFGYRVTSTEKTIYQGVVGNIIDPDDWIENRFDFGLYVVPKTLEGQRFPVIGYWVN